MPDNSEDKSPNPEKIIQEKSLISWSAPSRPFKRRSKDFYTTVIVMAALFGLVLFLVEGLMPILLLISLVFLFYVMSTIEPENIDYEITNLGIKIAGKRTDWKAMGRFWYAKRFGSELLVIETTNLVGRMEIMVKPEVKEQVTKIISQHLLHEQVPPSSLDKLASWSSRFFPE
jgi:4-amino-4-deoxy-L-arabinose transferase-like glycosyltransferase